jgi:hypothetical protein
MSEVAQAAHLLRELGIKEFEQKATKVTKRGRFA